jgi:CheY-like chemotaxis protein
METKMVINRKRILIAEDDANSARMLKDLLTASEYDVTIAENGIEAIKYFEESPFPLVITDIEMPQMDGNELISRLNMSEIPPVIIVTTVHKEFDLIIDIMKKGAYEYLVKPLNLDEVLFKVSRGFEAYDLKKSAIMLEKEKTVRLESQLDWYRFADTAKFKEDRGFDNTLFTSFHTAFNQGGGFGALVSLLNIVESSAQKEGENYLINGELFDLVKDNNRLAQKALDTFGEIHKIMINDPELATIECISVYDMMKESINDHNDIFSINNHHCSISDPKPGFETVSLNINKHYFATIFEEILINSCKFSVPGSKIYILTGISGKNFIINILNEPPKNDSGSQGIPVEYENLVFEPFFRLTKLVYDNYPSIDFGCGLTLVRYVIEKHGGKITLSNIKDMSDINREPVTKVNCEIILPLVPGK